MTRTTLVDGSTLVVGLQYQQSGKSVSQLSFRAGKTISCYQADVQVVG